MKITTQTISSMHEKYEHFEYENETSIQLCYTDK
jgi:hypothetical protein